MLSVKSSRGLHDGRGWMIGSMRPYVLIDGFARYRSKSHVDDLAQVRGAYGNRSINHVVVNIQFQRRRCRSSRSDENWNNRNPMAGLVEILQVQSVIPCLVHSGTLKDAFAYFELNHKHDRTN